MHKQDNTTTDKGLEAVMESMYAAAAREPLCEKTVPCDKCNGAGCDHCNGTGKHTVEEGEVCPKCGKVHTINAGCSKAHEATSWRQHDVDHHNQYMMDQDLLQPLHAAAIEAGAKDINDWMIQQIKAQGENWTNWFIDTVIRGE